MPSRVILCYLANAPQRYPTTGEGLVKWHGVRHISRSRMLRRVPRISSSFSGNDDKEFPKMIVMTGANVTFARRYGMLILHRVRTIGPARFTAPPAQHAMTYCVRVRKRRCRRKVEREAGLLNGIKIISKRGRRHAVGIRKQKQNAYLAMSVGLRASLTRLVEKSGFPSRLFPTTS